MNGFEELKAAVEEGLPSEVLKAAIEYVEGYSEERTINLEPGGIIVIEVPGRLSMEEAESMQARIYTATGYAHRIFILDQGARVRALNDGELVQALQGSNFLGGRLVHDLHHETTEGQERETRAQQAEEGS